MRQKIFITILRNGVLFFLMTAFGGPVLFEAFAETSTSFPPSVNENYVKTVLPILKQSCFACHGPKPQSFDLIQDPDLRKKGGKSIDSAQAMLQMEGRFPFSGDENPKQDLKDMAKALKKGWMPPEDQTKFKLGTPLNDADKRIILDWVEKSMKTLEAK
jgi:hypothetical protein